MTPEHWRRVEALFHAASELLPDRRGEYLAEACQGDSELRRAVEKLLAQDGSNGKILDRPAGEAISRTALMPQLLAHVLVHEITLILQGVSRHSGEGVMKAQWGQGDFNRMLSKPLEFTSEDVSLIHDGLAVRMARSGAVNMNGSE